MAFQLPSLRQLESIANKLEKSKLLIFLGFTILYSAATYWSSTRKLMWNDELYTYYIARLPTMSDVWGALMSGGEQLPPFFYIITRASIALFGVNSLAFRLPEMLGFWVMCLCLFIFVGRRTSTFYGLLAAVFPLVTSSYYYSYEARPYGLMLGFSALALLCWQSATMNRWRPLSIIFLGMSLAGALSVHYYGVFVILPLALGEVVRTLTRRKIDAPVWAMFVLAVVPLFWHLPLIRQARANSGVFWAQPQWMNIPDFYFEMLYLVVLPLTCLIFFAGIYQNSRQDIEPIQDDKSISDISHLFPEIIVAVGFIMLPIFGVITAKFVTGAFTSRYAICAIIGFSILISLAATRIYNNNRLIVAVLMICFFGWFGILTFKEYWKPGEDWGAYPESKIQLIKLSGEPDLPIVAAETYTFIELEHYAPPEISSRVVYLADPQISLQRIGSNSIELGTLSLFKPWFQLNVTDYKPYIASRPRFLLCGNPQSFSWIVPQLEQDGMRLELKGNKGKILIFLVTPAEQENSQTR